MTIAVDFDGVIHAYSKGWQDGSIYDDPLPGALAGLRALMDRDAVFIHTTRTPHHVAAWLREHGLDAIADSPVTAREFWNERGLLLVSRSKYPATVYLDDRALHFTNWDQALTDLIGPSSAEQSAPFAELEPDHGGEDEDDQTDSDSDVLALISEIASRLEDATDEGEYNAASLIGDLANGRKTVAEARTELADITFRHV